MVRALRGCAGADRHHGHGIHDSPHRRGGRTNHPHGRTDPRRRDPRPFRPARHDPADDRSSAGDRVWGGDGRSVVDGEVAKVISFFCWRKRYFLTRANVRDILPLFYLLLCSNS